MDNDSVSEHPTYGHWCKSGKSMSGSSLNGPKELQHSASIVRGSRGRLCIDAGSSREQAL